MREFIIITGMHRSGTSCLAGSLEARGLYLGDVVNYAPFNKKGNKENKQIYQFHEKVFNSKGASWDSPCYVECFSNKEKDELMAILSKYGDEPVVGIKDPRILFFIGAWEEFLGDQVTFKYIASFRYPYKVAKSLEHRNKFELEDSVKLWEEYNTALLKLIERRPVLLVNFDLPSDSYVIKIDNVSLKLGLIDKPNEEFFTEELVNQTEGSNFESLSDPVIYEKLLSLHDE
ncbi:hypothetical protein [uncultured Gilvimarinus sp.]|uniref:hypothetical protein n=1 Tax=uncultured Gilvimarinus sp. TaxID=1689143 RepID=UPI0030DCB0E2